MKPERKNEMKGVHLPHSNRAMLIQRLGRIWGWCVTRHGRQYLDRRCAAFPVLVSGAEHLRSAAKQPCLIVANHVLIRDEDAPLGRLTQARLLTLLNQPPDSFILRRIVRKETGLRLHTVAKSDRGWWSPRPFVRAVQKHIGQPFGKGLLEGMDFIPIEHNPDCFHRTFLQSAIEPIRRGQPILIFPGLLACDENGCRDLLVAGGGQDTDARILPGAAHLARKFSLPILPVFLEGCDSWRPEKVTQVTFGPAFHPQGMTKVQINHAIVARMQELTSLQPMAEVAALV